MTDSAEIPVKVIRSKNRRRTIAIQVHHDQVVVRAPLRTTDEEIRALIKERHQWIQSARARAAAQRNMDHEGVNETIWYMGEPYRIRYIHHSIAEWVVERTDNEIVVRGPAATLNHAAVRDVLYRWYRRQAESILPDRIMALSHHYGYQPDCVRIKDQRTRWGSCSAARNINLNWRLIMAPLHVADYVMVHELCHLQEMNHSPRFWKLVRDAMPDYEEARNWLKTHADQLRW